MSGIKETKPLAEIDPEMFELVAAAKRRAPWRQTFKPGATARLYHYQMLPLESLAGYLPLHRTPFETSSGHRARLL